MRLFSSQTKEDLFMTCCNVDSCVNVRVTVMAYCVKEWLSGR